MTRHWWARLGLGLTPVSDPLQADERPDARFEAEWRTLIKRRALVLLGCLVLWAIGIEATLIFVQVLSHKRYADKAVAQHIDTVTIEASRGDILDRNGRLMARSIPSFELTADPSLIKDAAGEARELCEALGDCTADERAALTATLSRGRPTGTNKPLKWALLRHPNEMRPNAVIGAQALIDRRATSKPKRPAAFTLSPKGAWRYYPKMDLAAQVVGFISPDGKAGAGVEWRKNPELSGVPGRMSVLRDGNQNEMLTRVEHAPQPGASIELTIDLVLQDIAERFLAEGIATSGARAGSVVMLETRTGEILANASWPQYNPNAYGAASDEERRNRTVQDSYEPGSTMKILTAAAGLNDGVLTPDTVIDCSPGQLTVPGRARPIREAHNHNYGVVRFEDVVVKSSNVGAAKAGLFYVGGERMLRYADLLGFGRKSSSDFDGEQAGRLPRSAASDNNALASLSIGYQASVTPMQLAAAVNAVANGGSYVQPSLVRATIRDGRREVASRTAPRPVISPSTAATLTAMLEEVVARGTGAPAALERTRVAGKTGTAARVQKGGGYSTTDYNVSFVGFAPSRNPEFTILVVVDSPHNVDPYGGTVAAPIFKKVAEAALQHRGVPPSINPAPPIVVAEDRTLLAPPARAAVAVPARLDTAVRTVMPDLRGLTLRDALRRASAFGLQMSPVGDGIVVSQSPAPGDAIGSISHGVLQLRREPATSAGGNR